MRAAFSYYIQGLLRRRANLRQRFRLAAYDVSFRLLSVEGDPAPPGPNLPPAAMRGSAHLPPGPSRPHSSRSAGSSIGWFAPSDGRGFLRRSTASGCRGPEGPTLAFGWPHSVRHATPADTGRSHGRPAWSFSMGPALESRGPVGSRRPRAGVAAIAALRWRRKSRCRIAARPSRCSGS